MSWNAFKISLHSNNMTASHYCRGISHAGSRGEPQVESCCAGMFKKENLKKCLAHYFSKVFISEIYNTNIIKSIHQLHPLRVTGVWGWNDWSQSDPLTLGERLGTSWTGRQSITELTCRDKQLFMLRFTSTGNSESPVTLTCMSEDCGRKPEHPQETHTVQTQKLLAVTLKVLATAPPN